MRRGLTFAILAVSLMVAAQNVGYQPDPNWRPPAEAVARANPLPATDDIVGGGRKLFRRNCAECHGEDGSGVKKAADLQLPIVQQQSDGALFWKITHGNPRRRMPSFSSLPELQRWQLVHYLRMLRAESNEARVQGSAPKQ